MTDFLQLEEKINLSKIPNLFEKLKHRIFRKKMRIAIIAMNYKYVQLFCEVWCNLFLWLAFPDG
jgi:hypothetical protein